MFFRGEKEQEIIGDCASCQRPQYEALMLTWQRVRWHIPQYEAVLLSGHEGKEPTTSNDGHEVGWRLPEMSTTVGRVLVVELRSMVG
ncbi:hypothetical protein L2E82_20221 [Cichorium intybus]|uniref:Uncharacterized protein n=1 Tax=Cichorium intybus TaxID=13427 RepID=A0ACB9DTJ0_CICIN|nr:hypothetical protein L2E82_20221 [Cichorium intybus]